MLASSITTAQWGVGLETQQPVLLTAHSAHSLWTAQAAYSAADGSLDSMISAGGQKPPKLGHQWARGPQWWSIVCRQWCAGAEAL
jgi:hypothetical protein